MYPKNAASPERISVGAIYLIADGTIQTTGASVRVMPQGGAAGAGSGTLACDTTSGIWHYTPTQAETNYTSFMVLVYKASSTSACVSVVTTATSVAGTVDVGAISGDSTAADNLETACDGGSYNIGGGGCVAASVTGAVGSVTGNVGGNVTGSIGALTSAAITDVWSTDALTEAYAADGAAGTPAQILYLIQQALTEVSISTTVLTINKLDGSTPAATLTLNDATTPTSKTRAT